MQGPSASNVTGYTINGSATGGGGPVYANGAFSGLAANSGAAGGGYTPPTGDGYTGGGGMPSWGMSGAGQPWHLGDTGPISAAGDTIPALPPYTPPSGLDDAAQHVNPGYTPYTPPVSPQLTPEEHASALADRYRQLGWAPPTPTPPTMYDPGPNGSGDQTGDPARWAQYNQSGYYQGLDPGAQSSLRSLLGL